jgi:hypothetical protein
MVGQRGKIQIKNIALMRRMCHCEEAGPVAEEEALVQDMPMRHPIDAQTSLTNLLKYNSYPGLTPIL